MPGSYEYEAGAQVPTHVEQPAKPGPRRYILVSFEDSGPIPPADIWPKARQQPEAGARTVMMFPGEEKDPEEMGVSPRTALEWLLDNRSEAKRLYENGCVERYKVQRPVKSGEGDPMEVPLVGQLFPEWTHHVFSILDASGEGSEWTVRHRKGPAGDEYEVIEVDEPFWARGGCRHIQITVSAHGSGHFQYWFVPLGGAGNATLTPVEDGWDWYSIHYVPSIVDLTSRREAMPLITSRSTLRPAGWS